MSLRLDWLCEWVTLAVAAPETPQIASSCAEPDRLRSLPRRRLSAGGATCCCSIDEFGAVVVEDFFLVGPPNPKNLKNEFQSLFCQINLILLFSGKFIFGCNWILATTFAFASFISSSANWSSLIENKVPLKLLTLKYRCWKGGTTAIFGGQKTRADNKIIVFQIVASF